MPGAASRDEGAPQLVRRVARARLGAHHAPAIGCHDQVHRLLAVHVPAASQVGDTEWEKD